ncbi:MAG: hypothetical protein ABIO70_25925, partial [Pseudomonadota bacterium]
MSDAWAIARYQAIAATIATSPPRGQRGLLLALLAARSWPGPDGEPFSASAETLRVWARRYGQGGLDALTDAPYARRGIQALTEEEVAVFCALKREVPARSLDRLIRIAEDLELVEQGRARRSTVHRALQTQQLTARKANPKPRDVLDRYQADFPNEIWQSDMLQGPWLPGPKKPRKMRKSWLAAPAVLWREEVRLRLEGTQQEAHAPGKLGGSRVRRTLLNDARWAVWAVREPHSARAGYGIASARRSAPTPQKKKLRRTKQTHYALTAPLPSRIPRDSISLKAPFNQEHNPMARRQTPLWVFGGEAMTQVSAHGREFGLEGTVIFSGRDQAPRAAHQAAKMGGRARVAPDQGGKNLSSP